MNSQTKNVRVVIAGKEYLVEVEDLRARPIRARLEGQTFEVIVDEPASEVKPPTSKVTRQPAPVVTPVKRVEREPSVVVSSGEGSKQVTAPMPGDIINVLVKPGDRVRTGQEICSLDAMKMKNAIRAPQDGVIASVEVVSGQAVDYGQVLVTFE
ncbi:MAG: biotin/lipoyl-containing protein [Chloroflexota bacterium]